MIRPSEYSGFAELENAEANLCCYNSDIVSKMSSYFGGKSSVFEFGAGIGTLAVEWRRQTGIAPECLEVDAGQQEIIASRGLVCYPSLAAVEKTFDGVYSSNVLEHIEDDVQALRDLHRVMSEGAALAIYVPAFMFLFSRIDRSLGHYRRYDRAELVEKVSRAGFRVRDCYYSDSIGFVAWFAARLFWNSNGFRSYDRWIYPVSRALDGLFLKRVAGKNLLLIAEK